MNRIGDNLLQVIFVGGLVLIVITLYFTRMAGLNANDQLSNKGRGTEYENYVSAFQFEQEEKQILTRLDILKADYASDLLVYKNEKSKLENSDQLSETEKREKLTVLDGIYSQEYFARKIELIDEENLKLQTLRTAKCRKFCVYQDLPAGS
jgi:hypothetical protein